MNTLTATLSPNHTLGELATTRAGASRVFHRHGLDFCCGGNVTLAAACNNKKLDSAALIAEIAAEERKPQNFERWDQRPLVDLIDHILVRYHASHREEVPRLLAMARKVEEVHAEKAECPRGLAAHLAKMEVALEEHMLKEEEILFPMIREGHGSHAEMPIQVMEEEHREHARNLERLRLLARDCKAPEEACGTWRALYLGINELEEAIMEHIHLENHVLFPKALKGR